MKPSKELVLEQQTELAEMLLSRIQELISKAESQLNLDYVDLDSTMGKQLCVPLVLAAFESVARDCAEMLNSMAEISSNTPRAMALHAGAEAILAKYTGKEQP